MAALSRFLFIALTAVLLAACSSSDSPEAVAKSFIEASFSNDADGMYKLIAVPADANEGAEEMVRGKLKMAVAKRSEQAEKLGGIDQIKADEAVYNDDKSQATSKVTITFKKADVPAQTESVRLTKVDDQWKVRI
ncbi:MULTISPECIES: DUF4878 domain-containing protein [unclassified Pseudomonas]|jgi:hypothetical protein|uniref:DUF4878 domain-containing protein n=1 Tax=unclassified Pseudomonas TaxID=196821 RepID=UPI000DABC3DF|nr:MULTISPECIES: DUF4878 domain-containing protein [unclassified Pseudomonas]MBD9657037.1 DUF4878 domain-containing protein [Pseudomonas sp. PDM12]PZW45159.1 uncharacterized protein DUF4878 [Pseudomonas sp. URMO17WK12:I2]